jgi:DNA-binding MurR/RpiR family transcriptional regulator
MQEVPSMPNAIQTGFKERVADAAARLSPAEKRVAQFFLDSRQTALLGSAAQIASEAGVSDATVVRTAKSLGFDGLSGLRAALLADLSGTDTPAARLNRTLKDAGHGAAGALDHVIGAHEDVVEVLKGAAFRQQFTHAMDILASARRRHIFGIGPSGAIAAYAALQFNRVGFDSGALSATGVGLADSLLALQPGDAVLMIAYAPIYREVAVTIDYAERLKVPVVLASDSLGAYVGDRVAETLPVPRGRADHLALHGGTMVMIEAMIVNLAARDPERALAQLRTLGELRGSIDKAWVRRAARPGRA